MEVIMYIDKIKISAVEFRTALMAILPELDSDIRVNSGACLDITSMLIRYLEEQELGVFQTVSGWYEYGCGTLLGSHTWLQSGDLIVDITADQFPDVTEPVIVRTNSEWHEGLVEKSDPKPDNRFSDEFSSSMLKAVYSMVVSKIENTR
jgi:hypothetical protein